MFGLDQAKKIFIYSKPRNMRKDFNDLFGLVPCLELELK